MKYLILFLFTFQAHAVCHLTSDTDQNGDLVLRCVKGFTPRNVLCSNVPRSQYGGKVYDVQIVTPPDGFIGNIRDLLGLNSRPWTPSEIVADGEQIVCTIDSDLVQAEVDAESARQAAQDAAQAARQKRRADALTRCQAQPGNSPIKALCALVLDQDL